MDDSHARFVDADHAEEFLCVLNSQDDKIQYTIEKENHEGVLAFLDISIRNNKSGRYEFSIHRKDAITNLQIHPESSVNPSTVFGVFKGFLTRAHRICSPNRLQEEVEFLVNMFEENKYDRERFEDIAKRFEQQSSLSSDSTIERQDEGDFPVVKLP